jgi:hypothetical protein
MELGAGSLFFGFTVLFPIKILFNIPGEEGEENPQHQGIVNHSDAGQGFRNEIQGIHEVDEAKETAYQGSGRHGAVAAGQNVPEHGGSGPDEMGEVGQFGAGAKGVHGLSTMLNCRNGNEEFDED